MYENLSLGSIVLLMNNENNIYKAMIIQHNVEENRNVYDYLAIPYSYGFVGVDSFTLVDNDNIFDVVYNSRNDVESNSEVLCPSSRIMYMQEEYLIIGKNVRNLGNEVENEYAVVNLNNPSQYEIKYIEETEIDEVITFGFINYEYRELEENRTEKVDLAMRRFRSFLPIGSRVLLNADDREIEVMIIARNIKDESGEISDYLGVNTEYGYIGNDYVFNFDKEHIIKIISMGFFNKQEVYFNTELLIDRKIMGRS